MAASINSESLFPRFSNTEYIRRYTAIREAMDKDQSRRDS